MLFVERNLRDVRIAARGASTATTFGNRRNMLIGLIPVFSLLIAGWLTGLRASGQSELAKYSVDQPG
jgi:hypothetical protein